MSPRGALTVSDPLRRVKVGAALFVAVVAAGTVGYVVLGFSPLDALYQTVVYITTVGVEVKRLDTEDKVFTIVLILGGVGTALYTFTAGLETLLDGHLRELMRRRRMERAIGAMTDHVIVCGWGRVGRQVAHDLAEAGRRVVVVDRSAERLAQVPYPWVQGDVAEDRTLEDAGITRAGTLVAALE